MGGWVRGELIGCWVIGVDIVGGGKFRMCVREWGSMIKSSNGVDWVI